MKKNTHLISLLVFALSLCSIFLFSPVYAESNQDISYESQWIDAYTEQVKVSGYGEQHIITLNHDTYILTIDGEKFIPEIAEVPLSRATIDYSSAINLSYDIPWRGTLAMAGAIMAAIPGIGWTIAAGIAGAISAEGQPLFITMTQYKSIENYYSSYTGSYYKKAINMNIRAYCPRSVLIFGPANDGWFDPVRPA